MRVAEGEGTVAAVVLLLQSAAVAAVVEVAAAAAGACLEVALYVVRMGACVGSMAESLAES